MTYATGASRATLFNQYEQPSYPEHAAEYLEPDELTERREEARFRIIKIFRFNDEVAGRKGYCHDVTVEDLRNEHVYGDPAEARSLALFLHEKDKKRSDDAYKQRKDADIRLITDKIRMPQNRKRRRSALFSGGDFEINIFEAFPPTNEQIKALVEVIRYNLMVDAVKAMIASSELEFVGDIWSIKVSTADAQRLAMMNGVAKPPNFNDHAWHGLPKRDRKRGIRLP